MTRVQALAIMHHAAEHTPSWPSDPDRLTEALAVAMGGHIGKLASAGFEPRFFR